MQTQDASFQYITGTLRPARAVPGSCENAGLVAVGGEQAHESAPEVPKLLAAVLGQDALPDGLQRNVARHARDDLLHEASEELLQSCQPLHLHCHK